MRQPGTRGAIDGTREEATSFSLLVFIISLGTVSTILSLLIITVMLLRRFIHAQRTREQWKLEIQQARHVQQMLIPDRLPELRGLKIESEYRPAREVGGDFFQIFPARQMEVLCLWWGTLPARGYRRACSSL